MILLLLIKEPRLWPLRLVVVNLDTAGFVNEFLVTVVNLSEFIVEGVVIDSNVLVCLDLD